MLHLPKRAASAMDEPDLMADRSLRSLAINLDRGDLLGLENARGVTLNLLAGQLWITQSDDHRDIIVDPGHSFRLDRDGLTLVTAVLESTLIIRPDSRSRPGRLRFEKGR